MARFEISDNVLIRKIADEAVLLDLHRGEYFGLNELGTRTLDCLTDGQDIDIDAIASAFAVQYDAEPARIRQDVDELLQSLIEHKLIERIG